MASDIRLVDLSGNVITAATVERIGKRNPLHVMLVNISGDPYGISSGGAASNVNINQVGGATAAVNVGNADNGTLRVVVASDQPAIAVTGSFSAVTSPPPVTGVQIVGGSVGGRVSISGDVLAVSQSGLWQVQVGLITAGIAITGDVLLRGGNAVAVKVDGSAVTQPVSFPGGISIGAVTAPIGITGDVSTLPKAGQVWPVREQGVIGVQVVGGASSRVSISGDVLAVSQSGAWNVQVGSITASVGITGDVSTTPKSGQVWPVKEQSNLGVILVGATNGMDRVGISGDAPVSQKGGWAVAVTGDVLLRQNATNTPIGTLSTPIGVQVIGGGINRVSISGDILNTSQQGVVGVYITGGTGHGTIGVSGDVQARQVGAWAVSVTGDILLRANPNVVIGQIGGTLGVNVIGGSIGAQISASGDLPIKPQVGLTKFPVSGDQSIIDGVDPTIKSTVRGYANSNPLAVALTNGSGDTYSPTPKEPILVTRSGRITSAGTIQIAGPYNGRVIKVTSYDIQAEADTAQAYFSGSSSGEQLSPQWLLNSREGVAKQVSGIGGGYIFKTKLNGSLGIENDGNNLRYSVTFQTGDSL